MAQLLFTLLAVFSGASIGAALFATWCLYKLRRLTMGNRQRWYLYLIFVFMGMAGTFGVLLAVIIPEASVTPSIPAWGYISFLGVAAYGLVGMAAVTADELASAESRTDESVRKENEDIREARTSEDKDRANLRGWEDDSRFTDEDKP